MPEPSHIPPSHIPPPHIPGAIQDQAADWAVRMHTGGLSRDDRVAFDAWLSADPQHRQAYRMAEAGWRDLAGMGGQADYAALLGAPTWRERIVAAVDNARGTIAAAFGRPAVPLAAVAVAALLAVMVWPGPAAPPVHQTEVGEIRDVALPDGSVVTLGARSRIDVTFSPDQRRVSLVSGEAFFSVEPDPGRPFVVFVGDALVRVVGTKFDIHRGIDQVRVAVVEGVVEVTRPTAGADDQAGPPPEAAVRLLTAGQQIVAARDGPLAPARPIAAAEPGAWRTGRLIYDGARLAEVMADANRYYAGHITIASRELDDLRVTTSFRATQIDQMIGTLTGALPLAAERRADGRIVLKPRADGQ